MLRKLKNFLKWLQEYDCYQAATLFVAIAGFGILYCQFDQSFVFKKYDNFLHFNKVYYEWYDDMPDAIIDNKLVSFYALDNSGKAWVRRYLNLYSDEYYFHINKMLPDGMWNGLIHGCKDGRLNAAFQNFKTYPALLQGYSCWAQDGGGFGFPEDFIHMLNQELKKCSIEIPDIKNCS